MTLRNVSWQEQGFYLLVVEAKPGYYHLLVSRNDREYAIYDRLEAPSLEAARASIRFNPTFYNVVAPPFLITKEAAWAGETGIPAFMEPMVKYVEKMTFPGETISDN